MIIIILFYYSDLSLYNKWMEIMVNILTNFS